MVKICGVEQGSFAEKAGILPQDFLVSVNGNDINDVLDYRFYMTERSLADREAAGKDDGSMPVLVDVSDPTRIIHRASPDVELPDWVRDLA